MKKNKLSFIGGDLITAYLINMFLEEGNKIITYAFDSAEDLINADDKKKSKIFAKSIEEAINFSDNIIFAMPFQNDSEKVISTFSLEQIEFKEIIPLLKNKNIFAGNLSEETINILEKQNTTINNLNENNEIKISNALITAEAAIGIIAADSNKTINGMKILVLGFGRLGKMVAKSFSSLNAKVTVEARKDADLAWINAYGYNALNLENLTDNIHKYDIIINTVPFMLLDKERIEKLKKDVFVLDLADERGIDTKEARKRNIKNLWALSLPAKNAPYSYAESIKNVMETILERK